MNQRESVPRFIVTCVSGEQCVVTIEPWGTAHVLAPCDFFRVESWALATGDVEVSYDVGRVVLGFTSDDAITITNRTGERLSI
jgi:hypothetical protein